MCPLFLLLIVNLSEFVSLHISEQSITFFEAHLSYHAGPLSCFSEPQLTNSQDRDKGTEYRGYWLKFPFKTRILTFLGPWADLLLLPLSIEILTILSGLAPSHPSLLGSPKCFPLFKPLSPLLAGDAHVSTSPARQ